MAFCRGQRQTRLLDGREHFVQMLEMVAIRGRVDDYVVNVYQRKVLSETRPL